ncbi:MAG: hypothetical protein QGI65_02540 [SAR324 cluster bacterium]|nr:hypothetical protein [SAR324 cluster bacterium]
MPLKPSELIREMQLVGIGFSSHDWNTLIKQLHIHISRQLNTKLYEVVNSASETKNWLKDTENLSADILNHNPDWLLFSLRKFESAENCLDLLDNVQRKSAKRVNLVMVIQSIKEELHSILTFYPTFELVNKMRFKISAPELLLNHHIPRFPRIPLNSQFQEIEYVSDTGSVVKQTPDEIPLNTLIPFKNIRKIQTNNDQLSPGQSIEMLLREHSKIADPKQVVGILREAKACYLFPGIPFNSIKNITFDKTRIEHLIRLDECTENNPPFKRFIAGLLNENAGKPKQKKTNVKQSPPQILCLCRYSIISNLMKKLLKGIGYANVVTVEEISPEDVNLKDSEVLLKLHDCNVYDFKGQILDWRKELDQILEPLCQFVFLNDIKSAVNTEPLPLQQVELEGLKEKLLGKEKAALTMNMHAESDQLLYSQEYDVLKKIEPLATLLSDALSTSANWESIDKDASEIKLQRALLLCEDENDASEMNFKLNHVQRKLWVNPFSIKKPEDLTQLKSKIIRSYLSPGSLIIKPAALKHLKKICLQTKQECKITEKTFNRQKEILKKTKSELKKVQSKKNKLALSWLETNLKELLFRDLQLLHSDSDIVG